ncbi:MAG: precorrin-6y C5,15-methyltransferase (decarboxylating) subunit CbiE [Lentisphaeria bacterium]|nr:precorrin-6y C5,15-methyltransferase (decarboxylating) subunit CbiE [Lentisphaeria bacterium]
MSGNKIEVIGWDNGFSGSAEEKLREAEVVVGAARLLDLPQIPASGEKVPVDGKIRERLPGLLSSGRRIAVLATGDPLYYGIGSTLLRFAPADRLDFHPAPTAFQRLFARLGQPWEKVHLFSLHARKTPVPYRMILSSPLSAVYGDAQRPAQKIAAELVAAFPGAASRRAAAGCDLGLPGEKVLTGTLAEIAEDPAAAVSLSVLALLPDGTETPVLPLGLPDDVYEHHRNMITHPEVRAVVLSKLRLAPGVLWDLGAGSGSVGIEAAGLCPELQVVAVEKDPERAGHIAANVAKEGLTNVRVEQGRAEELLDSLPVPTRIFLGGGGPDLFEKAFAKLAPGGLLVMTAVMLDTLAMMSREHAGERQEFLTIQVSRAEEIMPGGSMLRAENPIAVGIWKKETAQ